MGDSRQNNLRAIRKAAGVTQAELCKKAGVYKSMVTGIEHNGLMPIQSNAERIAEALGVGVTDIWPDYRQFYSGYRPQAKEQEVRWLRAVLEAAEKFVAEQAKHIPESLDSAAYGYVGLIAVKPLEALRKAIQVARSAQPLPAGTEGEEEARALPHPLGSCEDEAGEVCEDCRLCFEAEWARNATEDAHEEQVQK